MSTSSGPKSCVEGIDFIEGCFLRAWRQLRHAPHVLVDPACDEDCRNIERHIRKASTWRKCLWKSQYKILCKHFTCVHSTSLSYLYSLVALAFSCIWTDQSRQSSPVSLSASRPTAFPAPKKGIIFVRPRLFSMASLQASCSLFVQTNVLVVGTGCVPFTHGNQRGFIIYTHIIPISHQSQLPNDPR